MRTCAKCGKNVSDGTQICPNCNSFMFNTDRGVEGAGSELLQQIIRRSPGVRKAIIVIMGIALVAMIAFLVWLYSQVM